jgi:hypothetical protein
LIVQVKAIGKAVIKGVERYFILLDDLSKTTISDLGYADTGTKQMLIIAKFDQT